jgi:diadenosine tetraphosphate (Ap4A) HIT family hydrolase
MDAEVPHFSRKLCPNCRKPNSPIIPQCSGCEYKFQCGVQYEIITSPCIFCQIVSGQSTDEKVRYQDERIIVFDAKFPVCARQWNISPKKHLNDITEVTVADIELVRYMRDKGMQVIRNLLKEEGQSYPFPEDFESNKFFFIGFNHPPSVPHLHMYVITLPVFYNPIYLATFPRTLTFDFALDCLEKYGKVLVGNERTDLTEHQKMHETFIEEHKRRVAILEQKNKSSGN